MLTLKDAHRNIFTRYNNWVSIQNEHRNGQFLPNASIGIFIADSKYFLGENPELLEIFPPDKFTITNVQNEYAHYVYYTDPDTKKDVLRYSYMVVAYPYVKRITIKE